MIYDFAENVNREAINTKETWKECFLNSTIIYPFHCDKWIVTNGLWQKDFWPNLYVTWEKCDMEYMPSIMQHKLCCIIYAETETKMNKSDKVVWNATYCDRLNAIKLFVTEIKWFRIGFEYWGNMGIDICLWIV